MFLLIMLLKRLSFTLDTYAASSPFFCSIVNDVRLIELLPLRRLLLDMVTVNPFLFAVDKEKFH